MDQSTLEGYLHDLDLPAMRYFQTTGSTNDEAWRWVDESALHGSLVVADEQTAGRGRFQRRWVTAPGSALAFSLVLRPPVLNSHLVGRLTGLAALAICKSLQSCYTLQAQIKWPNDILLDRRKVAGILVETRWEGENLLAAVVGIGINIAPDSVSEGNLPPSILNFPANFIEAAVGHPVDRWELLHNILDTFYEALPSIDKPVFVSEWQQWLAYVGQLVELTMERPGQASTTAQTGKLVGLTQDGSIKLLTASGDLVTVEVGELQLRPARSPDEME